MPPKTAARSLLEYTPQLKFVNINNNLQYCKAGNHLSEPKCVCEADSWIKNFSISMTVLVLRRLKFSQTKKHFVSVVYRNRKNEDPIPEPNFKCDKIDLYIERIGCLSTTYSDPSNEKGMER